MVIQHNISAMNANRQLGLVNGRLAKSSEKLSSGYKINRAADNAAGLSISEKMRKQIRGLNRASENIEDGISLCQVADGALNETVDILQRMRELAVQSANGTNSESDRQCIEMEVAQLRNEIDRIAQTTKFNDVVYPLNAPIESDSMYIDASGIFGLPENNQTKILLYEKTVTFQADKPITYEGKSYAVGDTITVTGITSNGKEILFDGGAAGYWNGNTYLSLDDDTTPVKFKVTESDIKIDNKGRIYRISKATGEKIYYMLHERDGTADPISNFDELSADDYEKRLGYRYCTAYNLKNPPLGWMPEPSPISWKGSYGQGVMIQAGATASPADKIPIRSVNATCKGLGILGVSLVTEESATRALDILDNAISIAASYRSMFGATQNRLEHAKKINDNTAENTQAAESLIRDADMADEMVRYSNANILAQAAQAMLSQANQSNQGVLSLIA